MRFTKDVGIYGFIHLTSTAGIREFLFLQPLPNETAVILQMKRADRTHYSKQEYARHQVFFVFEKLRNETTVFWSCASLAFLTLLFPHESSFAKGANSVTKICTCICTCICLGLMS